MVYDKLDKAYELFYYGEDPAEYFENTNFEFDISKNGDALLSTYGGGEVLCSEIREYTREYYKQDEDGEIIEQITDEYTLTGYVVSGAAGGHFQRFPIVCRAPVLGKIYRHRFGISRRMRVRSAHDLPLLRRRISER